MRCYFNDVVGSIIFLWYLGVAWSIVNVRYALKLWHIELTMFVTGLAWEYITPLYRSDTTSDIYDIVAYLFGGILFWYVFEGKSFGKT